ncbi:MULTISPECIES: putative manganese-dependent inorganic diphosphatase [Faecalibacterium]|mgnify:FL=1|jgi:manganese-dependent inorganic pyrophosphatase|uniref:putative manganese-dependent inorganic diphosphatase n=1 Tax=Faecalibacterium TaxID=216851 RepID=UPI000E3F3826|nr:MULTISPECIES: putative manganese-dependent inorganic diphosphatase [Faecalibacterium]MBC5720115.1 putative manganese-dependent inorganic diphosphatase [Faecalibacterium duncaniae]MBS6772938.1 putative manganese-dependent inorganic diphosphatase [Faecalibacterium prausnitzii]MEE0485353.1 putative manganese-dependent inorganic diphosphatase [Faecalibacterium sp.]RGC29723.1 putative manganese-dependent inorganic diphosphatase [Faecalibacterium prausnitzii]
MPKEAHKVVVIGHRNPDTDSICSAIAYAELKNRTSTLVCEPRRAGKMNQETEFVLKKFGVTPPRMCTDVNPKIRDVDYREMPGIPGSTSLRRAWKIMRDQQIDTLSITSADNELEGIITVKDLATANMDVFDTAVLAKSRTSYKNILETLNGTMVVGDADAVCTTGHIKIGTATPEMLESSVEKGDIVILSNRYESQLCAIEKEASLLIICNGAKVGRTIQRIADETGVAIMTTPEDTYAAGKLISQCAPISYYMTRDNILKFTLVTPVADVLRVMAKVRHRYFPILDEDGKYCGMVSRRNVIALRKRRIILVDHNEATQAVEGFDQAEILEIIDHHRIGSLETSGPVYFRNQPVGCTATIITQMYDENGVDIPPQIAGLLLAAILSDTLAFRSPTCTPVDENAAKRLAKIAGVDIEEFSTEMFEAGEKLDGKTPEEVFLQDFKVFMCGDIRFGVAQGSYMTRKNLQAAQALLQPYLEEARNKQNVEDLYMLLTDVPKEESVVICTGRYAAEVLSNGFESRPAADGSWTLPGVVSRKKQFIPAMMSAYQEL